MSETKFTPGPWHWHFAGSAGAWVIRSASGPVDFGGAPTNDPAAGNMALIAAAPDLYMALNRIVESVARGASGDVCQTFDFDDARAALAKARGET